MYYMGIRDNNSALVDNNAGSHAFEFQRPPGPLEPEELVISAIKKSESGDELVVRFYNTSGKQVTGKISVFGQIESATMANLLEQPIEELPVLDNSVTLSVGGHQIITVKFCLNVSSI